MEPRTVKMVTMRAPGGRCLIPEDEVAAKESLGWKVVPDDRGPSKSRAATPAPKTPKKSGLADADLSGEMGHAE